MRPSRHNRNGIAARLSRDAWRVLVAGVLLICLSALPARADAVQSWNGILLDAIRATRPPPPQAARLIAMVNVAMFDSANAAAGLRYQPYSYDGMAVRQASPEVAASAAGAAMIRALFPDLAQRAPAVAARAATLATVPRGAAAAVELGEACAAAVLKARADDGSRRPAADPPPIPVTPGLWRPTPPAFAPPLLPHWGAVRTWIADDLSAHRVGPPPPPNSAAWFDSYNGVKALGTTASASHDDGHTGIARFWADDEGTETPPGHWVAIALALSAGHGGDVVDHARLFTLLGITLADVGVMVWEAKYRHAAWRPVTAIREAASLGIPRLVPDPGWTPVLNTPPFPEYPSGHSAFSAAGARILALMLDSDAIAFDTDSRGAGVAGMTRHFERLSDAAEEAGLSRIYGGIHFYFAHRAGAELGRQLADLAFAQRLRPQAR